MDTNTEPEPEREQEDARGRGQGDAREQQEPEREPKPEQGEDSERERGQETIPEPEREQENTREPGQEEERGWGDAREQQEPEREPKPEQGQDSERERGQEEEPGQETIPTPTPTLDEMLARLSPSELKALFLKYLGKIGAKGRARQSDALIKKKDAIIAYVGVHGRITHGETMKLIKGSKTSATRILQALEIEGRLVQHGGYKDHAAYYTIRL